MKILLLFLFPCIAQAQYRPIVISSVTPQAVMRNFNQVAIRVNRSLDKYGNDTVYGSPTFKNGIKVSTSPGQMFLVHYSTALISLAVGGVTGSPAALSSDLVRVGNLVTITVPAMANYTKDGNAGPITLSSIPAGFRPNNDVAWVLPCVINNAYNTARLGLISSTGVFNFYYANDIGNTPPNNFAGGLTNNYCDTGFSVSWTVR